jgi:hypothetical protein
MDASMREDEICGNVQCRHKRHEHNDGKRCGGFLPKEWNLHGEVEAADEECKCPHFHEHEMDYRKSPKAG